MIKFCADRLACVSEHFAGALAGALGVATPACRLARRDDPPRDVSTAEKKNVSTKNETKNEWFAALDAARRLCSCDVFSETDDDVKDGTDVTKDSVRAFAACLREKHECALAQRFVVGAPFFARAFVRLRSRGARAETSPRRWGACSCWTVCSGTRTGCPAPRWAGAGTRGTCSWRLKTNP